MALANLNLRVDNLKENLAKADSSVDVLRVELASERSKNSTIEKAASAERAALDARLEAMNGFRAAMQDQAGKFISRTEVDAHIKPLSEQLSKLSKPDLLVWATLLAFFATVIAGSWYLVGLQIDYHLAPLRDQIIELQTIIHHRG